MYYGTHLLMCVWRGGSYPNHAKFEIDIYCEPNDLNLKDCDAWSKFPDLGNLLVYDLVAQIFESSLRSW